MDFFSPLVLKKFVLEVDVTKNFIIHNFLKMLHGLTDPH